MFKRDIVTAGISPDQPADQKRADQRHSPEVNSSGPQHSNAVSLVTTSETPYYTPGRTTVFTSLDTGEPITEVPNPPVREPPIRPARRHLKLGHEATTMTSSVFTSTASALPVTATHTVSTTPVCTIATSALNPVMSITHPVSTYHNPNENTEFEPPWVAKLISHINTNKQELIAKITEVSSKVSVLETQIKIVSDLTMKVSAIEESLETTNSNLSSVQSRLSELEKSMTKQPKSSAHIDKKIADIEEKEKTLLWRAIDQEARSRRNNLVFHGIGEDNEENCEKKLLEFLKHKLHISEPVVIQRAHRQGKPVGKNSVGSRANKPRPLIALFLDFKQRETVRKAARQHLKPPTHFGVSEDLPVEIRKARQSLSAQLKELRERGKRVTVLYPCKLLCDGEIVENIDVVKFANSTK